MLRILVVLFVFAVSAIVSVASADDVRVKLLGKLHATGEPQFDGKKVVTLEQFHVLVAASLDMVHGFKSSPQLTVDDAGMVLETLVQKISSRKLGAFRVSFARWVRDYYSESLHSEKSERNIFETYGDLFERAGLGDEGAVFQELDSEGYALIASSKLLGTLRERAGAHSGNGMPDEIMDRVQWNHAYTAVRERAIRQVVEIDHTIKNAIAVKPESGKDFAALLMTSLLSATQVQTHSTVFDLLSSAGPRLHLDVVADTFFRDFARVLQEYAGTPRKRGFYIALASALAGLGAVLAHANIRFVDDLFLATKVGAGGWLIGFAVQKLRLAILGVAWVGDQIRNSVLERLRKTRSNPLFDTPAGQRLICNEIFSVVL